MQKGSFVPLVFLKEKKKKKKQKTLEKYMERNENKGNESYPTM